jgi:hypothetical protein
VLLDSDWDDGAPEKLAAPNKNSLKGFEIVDEIKQKLEAVCPMTVSCADIIALSARHAVIQVRHLPPIRFPSALLRLRSSKLRSERNPNQELKL